MNFTTTNKRLLSLGLPLATLTLTLGACGGGQQTSAPSGLTGDIMVDGSSTVFPISEAMAEEFMAANSGTRVTVGVSGSGGGFKKFCAGETDISNASRPIKGTEVELCQKNGIEFIEIPVAFDGVSVVVNKENDWAACLTAEELGKMWEPAAEGKITKWNQIKSEYPNQDLALYGPGTDSGTYDYFTDATTGEEGESRGDYTASEDDNVIVQGVQNDKGGLGFFGFAYYEENKDTLKVVNIKNAAGECIPPSQAVIANGTYNPLSRPIFFYVKKAALEEKPQVKAFAEYQIDAANGNLISEVGYVPLPTEILAVVSTRLGEAKTGSVFTGGSTVGANLKELLAK